MYTSMYVCNDYIKKRCTSPCGCCFLLDTATIIPQRKHFQTFYRYYNGGYSDELHYSVLRDQTFQMRTHHDMYIVANK